MISIIIQIIILMIAAELWCSYMEGLEREDRHE